MDLISYQNQLSDKMANIANMVRASQRDQNVSTNVPAAQVSNQQAMIQEETREERAAIKAIIRDEMRQMEAEKERLNQATQATHQLTEAEQKHADKIREWNESRESIEEYYRRIQERNQQERNSIDGCQKLIYASARLRAWAERGMTVHHQFPSPAIGVIARYIIECENRPLDEAIWRWKDDFGRVKEYLNNPVSLFWRFPVAIRPCLGTDNVTITSRMIFFLPEYETIPPRSPDHV